MLRPFRLLLILALFFSYISALSNCETAAAATEKYKKNCAESGEALPGKNVDCFQVKASIIGTMKTIARHCGHDEDKVKAFIDEKLASTSPEILGLLPDGCCSSS